MPRVVRCGLIQASNVKPATDSLESIKSAMIEKHLGMIEEAAQRGVQIRTAHRFRSRLHEERGVDERVLQAVAGVGPAEARQDGGEVTHEVEPRDRNRDPATFLRPST